MSCVEIEGGGGRGGCLLQKKMDKEEVEMGEREESRAPGHKLNITDRLTDRIIPMVTLSVEISCHRMIFLLESFVITSVMSLVYIDGSFYLRYSRMNFTTGIILSVTLYVKLTSHYIVCLFFFNSFFSHCDSLGIYHENISVCVYQWI